MLSGSARPPLRATGRARALVLFVDRQVYRLTFHWVAFVNLLLALYIGPAFAAPLLAANGYAGLSRLIYTLYGPPVCHQLPERSFFLGGPRLAYTLEELEAGGAPLGQTALERRRFVGDARWGYKMAFCQRDVSLYGGVFCCGIIYALAGRRRLKALPWQGFVLFLLPLAVDGLSQLVGLRASTALGRVVTGLLAAAGGVWFAYPFIEEAMLDLRRSAAAKLGLPA